MRSFDAAHFFSMFSAIAERLADESGFLCELDGAIGDADHGVSMSLGFDAVRRSISEMDLAAAKPSDVFVIAATSFLNAVGASTGPLYATALLRAGSALRGKDPITEEDVFEIMPAMARGIQERGNAAIGQKTMVDAWAPAAAAILEARRSGGTLASGLDAARRAADEGAETTKAMIAEKGRSSRLGDRTIGHMDPGAASAAMIIAVMAKSLSTRADLPQTSSS